MPDRVCSNCKFWHPEPEVETVTGKTYKVQGECGGIPTCWDWRLEDGDPLGDKALMVDANARLFTAPDFGCAAWEAS